MIKVIEYTDNGHECKLVYSFTNCKGFTKEVAMTSDTKRGLMLRFCDVIQTDTLVHLEKSKFPTDGGHELNYVSFISWIEERRRSIYVRVTNPHHVFANIRKLEKTIKTLNIISNEVEKTV